ncbi:TonB-dependent receptor [Aureisphaera sp. CAU 1614]|uniref:TonB-dependent receptor n=1 Tax=Halomarinibacterium sedimenti TaxID=2857106 RepID=A0A9X1FNX3_9FLAO|nr:TonB-dependent receptor [Halomarinibacterium sedimenti]MBW2937989.1 TonB-dependent receptor [Halomarinibacterium sedimenti]
MKNIYSLFGLLFISQLTFSQATLEGSIVDENNQSVLATVYLPQIEKGAVSDVNGKYLVTQIPNGNYTVIISALGYETLSFKLSFLKNETIAKHIVLKERAVEMEEVIISTPFHKLQSENVMKVERITTEQLTKNGAVNLSQGISNMAGVSTVSTGNGIGKPVIRGLSSNRVLTYTQGVRLENQQFGDEHGLGISGNGIESVEVIKGPASLLYGSDAIGGVLYLNPEGFATDNETEVDGTGSYFSNTKGFNSSIGAKTSGEKVKFLVRGSRASFSDYETGDEYRVTNTRYNEYDIKTGIRFQDKRLKSTLRYNYNRSNIGIPEEIGAQNTSKELLLPFQEIDNHILSLDNTLFLNNSSLDIKTGYLFNDRREFEESADEAALRLKLNTFTYDVKYNLPELGHFTTIVGVQGMLQDNKNFGEEILIPNAKKVDFGVFATTHLHLKDWDFQGGLRLDTRKIKTEDARNPQDEDFIPSIDKDYNSFNVALGAKYNFSETFTGRLNLASGFRAPNLAELTSNGVHEGTNRYEIGNPDLNNEQSFQTDLAFEYRSEHFEAFANGFYNTINNYIFISPTGDVIEDNRVFNYVQNGAKLFGGEIGFHLHPHPLDWLHWESSYETVIGELKEGGNLPLIPANTLNNTIRLELNDGGFLKSPYSFITLENIFAQNNASEFETTTKGYNLLSLGFGATVKWNKIEFNWGVNATNITNESFINHLSRLKADEILNPGRSINFNLGFTL